MDYKFKSPHGAPLLHPNFHPSQHISFIVKNEVKTNQKMIVILCTLACVSFAQDIVQQSEDNESIARAQLGIVTQYVNVSQWTPEGTKYKIQAQGNS